MNNEELKEALFQGCPVVLHSLTAGDIVFKRVSAIIYRVQGGKLTVTAEILDKCGHSVVICDPAKVRRHNEREE